MDKKRQRVLTREGIAAAGAIGELICPHCLKNFVYPGSLAKHIAIKHPTPLRSRSWISVILSDWGLLVLTCMCAVIVIIVLTQWDAHGQ